MDKLGQIIFSGRTFKLLCLIAIFVGVLPLSAFDKNFWSDIQKFPIPKYRIEKDSENSKSPVKIYYEGEFYKGKSTKCSPITAPLGF